MRYLLDTDVVIDHFRGKRFLDLKFIQAGSISIITLAELLYGVYKSHNPKKSLETLQKNILTLQLNVENLNDQAVDEFGQIKAGLEMVGNRLDDFDLLIAATASVTNCILVTRNLRHFERIKGLKLYTGLSNEIEKR